MADAIDRKLCLTAAVAGASTRKELAAAFRRVNPATVFDLDRAHKWLQGRARPRDRRLYLDWARLLDVGEPPEWIAESTLEAFTAAIAARHALAPETLLARADAFARARCAEEPGRGVPALAGVYAAYSHAWSAYFRGRLIRGVLEIAPGPRGLRAAYGERLPTGRMWCEGTVGTTERAVYLDVAEPASATRCLFCLFPPTAPVSVLGGLMCGATALSPEPRPTVTRIVLVRVPVPVASVLAEDAYLAPGASLAADLARLGLRLEAPALADRRLGAFLLGGEGGGMDQIASAAYAALVDLFDRPWLQEPDAPPPGAGENEGVVVTPRRWAR